MVAPAIVLGGCANVAPMRVVTENVPAAELGVAREALERRVAGVDGPRDRDELDRGLDWLRLGIVTVADGYAPGTQSPLDEVYALLRTSNVNADRRAAARLTNESVKVWKGEPFEQAFAFHYVGCHYAMQGSWDNARAAWAGASFPLLAVVPEAGVGGREVLERSGDDDLEDAQPVDSDFTLAYLMEGIAHQQMHRANGDPARRRDAETAFAAVRALDADLVPLLETLEQDAYDVVLVVEAGVGPQKIGTGPDGAIAAFDPITSSDGAPLRIVLDGIDSDSVAAATDVNRMAADHRWNDLEDLRLAKAVIGRGLTQAGLITASVTDDRETAGVGLLIAAIGLATRANAHADTRYCEALPQRVYVVALDLPGEETPIELAIPGRPASRMTVRGLTGRANSGASPAPADFRLVRLVTRAGADPNAAPAWARSGAVLYATDDFPDAGEIPLPWILGGSCVRPPSPAALARYQAAGFLRDMTPGQLEGLYMQEGIHWTPRDANGRVGRHILEGGRSLVPPLTGTTGHTRLLGQRHPAYRARSEAARRLSEELAPAVAARRASRTP